MSTTEKNLNRVAEDNAFKQQLIAKAPYYPDILQTFEEASGYGKEWWFATKVRVKRDGKWYAVPVLRTYITRENDYKAMLLSSELRVHNDAYLILILWMPDGKVQLDNIQEEENERLKKGLPHGL